MHAVLFGAHPRHLLPFAAIGFMGLEYGLGRLSHHSSYEWRESAASLAVALGRAVVRAADAGVVAVPFDFVYRHRLLDFGPTTPLSIAALFLGVEFLYYWFHRASHRIRWFWATHSVHHSPTKLNFSAAVRLGWTNNLAGGFLFYLPLIWIGFHPLAVLAMLAANLLYQFFIHTELVDRLGALEWVLNTPAHHRVHHASNTACLDKNYGGVLIVFDRLFGTFAAAPEGEPLRYGLVGVAPTLNPLKIALGEWVRMLGEAIHTPGLSRRLLALFAPPDYRKAGASPVQCLPFQPSKEFPA